MEMGSNLVNLKNEGLQKILRSFSRVHVFLYVTFSFLQRKTALLRGGGGGRGHITEALVQTGQMEIMQRKMKVPYPQTINGQFLVLWSDKSKYSSFCLH